MVSQERCTSASPRCNDSQCARRRATATIPSPEAHGSHRAHAQPTHAGESIARLDRARSMRAPK